jgi:hypothetical protein
MTIEAEQTGSPRAQRPDPNASRFALCNRVEDLNREMLQLPLDERKSAWKAYYNRLDQLVGQ